MNLTALLPCAAACVSMWFFGRGPVARAAVGAAVFSVSAYAVEKLF